MIVLNALQWNYQTDLNAPPGRWSCEFLESGSTRFVPGESLTKQGGAHVAIDVVIDGASERLLEGIVREWGSDEDRDSVVGSAEGIDLVGVLLDFFPSSAVTYRGMELLSAGTAPTPAGARKRLRLGSDSLGNDVVAAFYETFQTVAAEFGIMPQEAFSQAWNSTRANRSNTGAGPSRSDHEGTCPERPAQTHPCQRRSRRA